MTIGSIIGLDDVPVPPQRPMLHPLVQYVHSADQLRVCWHDIVSEPDQQAKSQGITLMRSFQDKAITGAKIWDLRKRIPDAKKPNHSHDQDPELFAPYVGYEDEGPRMDALVVRWQAGRAMEDWLADRFERPIILLRSADRTSIILGFILPSITAIARLQPPR